MLVGVASPSAVPLASRLRKGETMYEKFKKKLEKILDFYSIVNDREAIMKDLSEVVNEAYDMGCEDAKEDY